jgi:TolA-binding protein
MQSNKGEIFTVIGLFGLNSRAILLLTLISFCAVGCALLPVTDEEQDAAPKYKSASELYKRAQAYYEARNYAKSRDLFQEYTGQFPDSDLYKIALYYLGHSYQELGEYKDALVIYNRIITTYGDDDFWGEQAVKRVEQIKGNE